MDVRDAHPMESPSQSSESIHVWFGLTYSNYLVLPRSVLQSMPQEWQSRFVRCLEQLAEATADLPMPARYEVQVLAREPEWITPDCPDCKGEGEDEQGNRCEFCDGDGLDPEGSRRETAEEVGFKPDPIPHYNRGRTRVPLRDPEDAPNDADGGA